MQKGDIVMADHPDSRSRKLIRSYGIVRKITKAGDVFIEMADGSLIKRKFHSIAVYIQPPSNWQELFKQQIVFSQPKSHVMARGQHSKQQHN